MSASKKFMGGSLPTKHKLMISTSSLTNDPVMEFTFDEVTNDLSYVTVDSDADGTSYAAVDKQGQRYWFADYNAGQIRKRTINPDGSGSTTLYSTSSWAAGKPLAIGYSPTYDLIFVASRDSATDELFLTSADPDTLTKIDTTLLGVGGTYWVTKYDSLLIIDDDNQLAVWCYAKDGQFTFSLGMLVRTTKFVGATGVVTGHVDSQGSDRSMIAKTVVAYAPSVDKNLYHYSYEASDTWNRTLIDWDSAGTLNYRPYSYTGYPSSYAGSVQQAARDPITGRCLSIIEEHRIDLWSPTIILDNYRITEFQSNFPELSSYSRLSGIEFLGDSGYVMIIFSSGYDHTPAIFEIDLSQGIINHTVMTLVAIAPNAKVSGGIIEQNDVTYLFTNKD